MSSRPASNRLQAGDIVGERLLTTTSGASARVPDHRLVHLQFRRFAGCPVCDLHLSSVARRHAELEAAGVRELVVFHPTSEALSPHAAGLPFGVVADPDKRLYVEFGVEAGPRALLHPRAWRPILRGIARSLAVVLATRRPIPSVNPQGGRFGLPADFLIASDGRVLACKYGEHVYDQWSVDEVLALAGRHALDPR